MRNAVLFAAAIVLIIGTGIFVSVVECKAMTEEMLVKRPKHPLVIKLVMYFFYKLIKKNFLKILLINNSLSIHSHFFPKIHSARTELHRQRRPECHCRSRWLHPELWPPGMLIQRFNSVRTVCMPSRLRVRTFRWWIWRWQMHQVGGVPPFWQKTPKSPGN